MQYIVIYNLKMSNKFFIKSIYKILINVTSDFVLYEVCFGSDASTEIVL